MARGFTPFRVDKIRQGIVAWDHGIRDAAEHAVRVTVAEGEEDVRRTIVETTSPTGEARAASGDGVAGRIESAAMYLAVASRVDVEGNDIVGRWGWINGAEDYFIYQEEGTEGSAERRGIDGMNALGKSAALVDDRVRARLRRLGREQRIG